MLPIKSDERKSGFCMKKNLCLAAAMVILFTACSSSSKSDTGTFEILPKDNIISTTIHEKYFSKPIESPGGTSDYYPTCWNYYLSGYDCGALEKVVAYVTVLKRAYPEASGTYLSARVDKVLYGDVKVGDTIILKQLAYITKNGYKYSDVTGYEIFSEGEKLCLALLKYDDISRNPFEKSISEDLYGMNPETVGYLDTINNQDYITYKHGWVYDTIGIELFDRGLVDESDDLVYTSFQIGKGYHYVPIVKGDTFEKLIALAGEYETKKWLTSDATIDSVDDEKYKVLKAIRSIQKVAEDNESNP